MQIHGPAHLHGPQPINPPHRSPAAQASAPRPAATVDQLDISAEAAAISRMQDVPEIRLERVASIKAQIASGEYETEAKLDAALDRLLDEIG